MNLTHADPQFAGGLGATDRRHYMAMLHEEADDEWMPQQQGPVIGTEAMAARVLDADARPKLRRGWPPGSKSGGISCQVAEVK